MEQAYKIGLAIGTVASAVLVIVIMLFQKSRTQSSYDERQILARGRAYRAGFYTLMTYMFLYGVTDALGLMWCDTITGLCLGIVMGTASFAMVAIHNDAFIGINERANTWSAISLIMEVINLAVGIIHSINGRVIGKTGLTFYSINFIVAALFAVIHVSLFIRNRRASEDDE